MDLEAGAGVFSVAQSPQRPSEPTTGPEVELVRELAFRDGPRLVPAHVAAILSGIDTEPLTYEEALARANQARLRDYIRSELSGMIPRA
jgi:hypothetical protein